MDREQAAAYAAQMEDELVDSAWNSLQERQQQAKQVSPSSTADASDGTIVAGPSPAPPREQSIDELAAELKRHPFFATSIDDVPEDSVELEALRALAYEGSRAEIAENFRNQGNERAQERSWADAREFYTKALAALKASRRDDEIEDLNREYGGGPETWEQQEASKEIDLKEKSLSNRALCQLSLKNYRSCSIDCVATLEINPRNVKAHYRLAQSLLALSKFEEANKAATTGLLVEPENGPLKNVKDAIEKAIKQRDATEQRRKAETERWKQQERVLGAALVARQIKVRKTDDPPNLEDAKMTLAPDPLAPTSSLVVPVLVLYPLHAQTDFVKAFGEEQTLADHLEYLLPLPWDEKGEYGDGKSAIADAYLETAEGGLVKWGRKAELLKLISGGKVEVVDGVVTVNLVPKARANEWIQDFKRRKGKA